MDRRQYIELNRQQPGEGHGEFSIDRYAHAVQYLPGQAKTIVDVGCNVGVGGLILRAARPNASLVGIEPIPERAVRAARHFDTVLDNTVCEELPIERGSVDAITALEVIEHLTESDGRALVGWAHTVLRASGVMILTTPNPRYLRLRLSGRSVLDDPSHLSQYSASQLRKMLLAAGFASVSCHGTGRMTWFIGRRFPWLSCYGSFLVCATK